MHMQLLEQRRLRALENETAVLGSSLEGSLELAMLGQRRDELQTTLRSVAQSPEILRVFILNNKAEVRLSSDSELLGQSFKPGEGRCSYCHTAGGKEPTPAAAALGRGERSFWSARPILNQPKCQGCHSDGSRVNGMLVVERSLDGFIQEMGQEKRQLANLSLGGFAASALILIVLLNVLVNSRLRHLSAQASRIVAEDLEHPLTVSGHDEVADLGHALDDMRVRLRTSVREIQAGKKYLEELMDGVHEGVLVLDRQMRVKRVNRSWSILTGKTPEEMLGKPCWQLCSSGNDLPHDCPARLCFQTGQEGWAIHTITDSRGRTCHLEVHCSPLKGQNGEITEVVEVTRDVSKRKELESQLFHAEKLSSVGRLAAGVAHEINNPMASISACAEGLQRRFRDTATGNPPPSEQEINEYLETIRKASRRCRDITSKLLDFARKDVTSRDLVDLNRLVEDAAALVRRSVSENCRIRTELDPKLPMVKGASGELTQLVFNLVQNAADAVNEGGIIRVTTSKEDQFIRLEVDDNGPGIPESALPSVFDPFYTTKPPGVGSGLGLFICKGIVDRHDGEIELKNKDEDGGGLTAVVRLPFDISREKAGDIETHLG